MEISQIENWKEVQDNIENVCRQINDISVGTERDIFIYFQSIRELSDKKTVICPYCEKRFSQIEVGLSPQKTMDDWEQEDRSEANAMNFEDFRKHVAVVLAQEMVHAILAIRVKSTPVEQNMAALKQSVDTVTYVSQRIHILSDTLKDPNSATTKDDLIALMTDALEDIRKAIARL